MVELWLPQEIQLVDQRTCEFELDGTNPITLKIKPTCPQNTQITEGLRAIVPKISSIHSGFWSTRTGLPTIWVCIQIFLSSLATEKNIMFCYESKDLLKSCGAF